MNAVTQQESASVGEAEPSQVNALALITLSPEKFAAEVYQPFRDQLKSAIDSVRSVDYDITTTAGMAVAVKSRALFRDMRIAADKERKARKEPITKIGKLLESGYDQVEERIAPLEELFDADIKAEEDREEAVKQAKIKAERERQERVDALIATLARLPARHAQGSAEEMSYVLGQWDGWKPDAELYGDDSARAADSLAASLVTLRDMLTAKQQSEAAALAAEEARLAEVARIEAEKVALAAERAENARVAAAQAAEAQRLADLAAQQQAAILAQQQAVEAQAQAERDAQAKVAAEAKRQMEAQQAAIAEQSRKLAEQQAAADARDAAAAAEAKARLAAALAKQQDAQRREDDHGPALLMNADFDAAREAERVRLQDLAAQHVADERPQSLEDLQSLDSLLDAMDDAELSNEEITAMGAEAGYDMRNWVARLDAYVKWARSAHPEVVA